MLKKYFMGLLIFMALSGQVFAQELPLPSGFVPLASAKGRALLASSPTADKFWQLNQYFLTQARGAYCGIASSVMILNASGVPRPYDKELYPERVFNQDNIFKDAVLPYTSPRTTDFQGNTLDEIAQLLRQYQMYVKIYYANTLNQKTFHDKVIDALARKDCFVMVNFSRHETGEQGYGHMSPVGAYSPETDSFLIFDVARYKYPLYWMPAEILWKGVNTHSNFRLEKSLPVYRGFLVACVKS